MDLGPVRQEPSPGSPKGPQPQLCSEGTQKGNRGWWAELGGGSACPSLAPCLVCVLRQLGVPKGTQVIRLESLLLGRAGDKVTLSLSSGTLGGDWKEVTRQPWARRLLPPLGACGPQPLGELPGGLPAPTPILALQAMGGTVSRASCPPWSWHQEGPGLTAAVSRCLAGALEATGAWGSSSPRTHPQRGRWGGAGSTAVLHGPRAH